MYSIRSPFQLLVLPLVAGALLLPAATLAEEGISNSASSQRQAEGYYKHLFMDGGAHLSSKKRLPAAESLGLSYERYAGKDKAKQQELIAGSEADTNGILLYPDGEPRFRMIYVNGGGATSHGKSLTRAGRDSMRRFYQNGGSYCGSCAGSFLSGRNVDKTKKRRLGYLHIFPYNTLNTGMKKHRVGHFIPDDSPLLAYHQFGDDLYVGDIYHNNGNWLRLADIRRNMENVEVLATYDSPEKRSHQGAAIWAYKDSPEKGRVVNIGSHPEGIKTGERHDLMQACLLYALDGAGRVGVKGRLTSGVVRTMDKSTGDNDPAHTKIGDRQYHHFTFRVPEDSPAVRVGLTGDEGFDLSVYLKRGKPALRSNADHAFRTPGATKSIRQSLAPGEWFVSVECETTVESQLDETGAFYQYSGKTEVLNGVAYTIEVSSAPDG